MFLRFLIATGQCAPGLEHALPTIAHWRLASLPKYLPTETVEHVLASCDRATPIGTRDRAVLLLLARLGLRAGDVAALKWADIDWPDGTLRVAGKNRRETRLPLPQEVGEAILCYGAHHRPDVPSPYVFLTTIAPLSPLSSKTVTKIAARALRRANVESPIYGAHVFRHSVATTLLRQGVSLPSIGALLRHVSIETTTLYAKVDPPLLHTVVNAPCRTSLVRTRSRNCSAPPAVSGRQAPYGRRPIAPCSDYSPSPACGCRRRGTSISTMSLSMGSSFAKPSSLRVVYSRSMSRPVRHSTAISTIDADALAPIRISLSRAEAASSQRLSGNKA